MSDGLNQKQLGANYRWDYDNLDLIQQIEKDINSILEKIENINNIITAIQNKITNMENKFDNEINVLYQQLGDNIDFLQKQINNINTRIGVAEGDITTIKTNIENINNRITQINDLLTTTIQRVINLENNMNTAKNDIATIKENIQQIQSLLNVAREDIGVLKTQVSELQSKVSTLETNLTTEIQNRIDGDNAINSRLNSIQFLKWLDRIEFGADLSQPQIVLGDEDFTVYYSFPEKYKYTNIWVIDVQLNQNSQTIFHNISEFGISWNVVGTDGNGNTGTFFQISYKHENNQHRGNAEPLKYYIYMLYTQYRTDAEPDIMPY